MKNRSNFLSIYYMFFFVLLSSCELSDDDLESAILDSISSEEIVDYAKQAGNKGLDGIPVLLEVIRKSLDDQSKLISYARISICLAELHAMAIKGVSYNGEVFELLNILRKERYVDNMVVTSSIISIITEVDVGLDSHFFETYTVKKEKYFFERIDRWEALINHKLKEAETNKSTNDS